MLKWIEDFGYKWKWRLSDYGAICHIRFSPWLAEIKRDDQPAKLKNFLSLVKTKTGDFKVLNQVLLKVDKWIGYDRDTKLVTNIVNIFNILISIDNRRTIKQPDPEELFRVNPVGSALYDLFQNGVPRYINQHGRDMDAKVLKILCYIRDLDNKMIATV